MYSAFIPGDTAVHFQIPAVADDGNAATWSLSDPTQAQLEAQMFPVGADMVPGVLITVLGLGDDAGPGPGQITVVASRSDGSCGTSTLNITANTADDYTIGQQRYNDGVALSLTRPAGFPDGGFPEGGFGGMGMMTADGGSFYERDGGTACTNCHGMNATNSAYKTVSHTPEQTGGFSDSQLIGIITQGNIPDGGYFDPSVIIPSCDGGAACTQMAFDTWHAFHQWADITPDEYAGIVVYLRALTPAPQTGVPGFAGGGRRMRGDGGMRPPPPFADAAAGSDAAPDAADAGAE